MVNSFYRVFNIPACYLGSAQSNHVSLKAGVMRYVSFIYRVCDNRDLTMWAGNVTAIHTMSSIIFKKKNE